MSWVIWTNGRSRKRLPRGRYLLSAVAVLATVAALLYTTSDSGGAPRTSPRPAQSRFTMAQAMSILETAQAHIRSTTQARATSTAPNTLCPTTPLVPLVPFTPVLSCFPGSPGLNAPNPAQCPEPTPPAATWPGHPAGAGYGIPFVASISNVVLLTGYNAYIAANPSLVQNAGDTNFNEPWSVVAYNITGWVTGLLELPSLTANIQPSQVVFCTPPYGKSANQCPSHVASTGCTWFVEFTGGTWQQAGFDGDCTKKGNTLPGVVGGCLPYVVTLAPDPKQPPQLQVIGLNSANQLEVNATAAADQTLTSFASGLAVTCKGNQATALKLSTEPPPPGFVPSNGPPAPPTGTFQGVPEPDDRPLQLPPSPITGPLRSIHASASSNNFEVPAFLPADQDPNQDPTCGTFWFLLDVVAAGLTPQQLSYYPNCDIFSSPPGAPCNKFVDTFGFAQATGATNIVYLGIPSTPPPGFGF